jgi:alcohol dehydrogenase (cytochrome c)
MRARNRRAVVLAATVATVLAARGCGEDHGDRGPSGRAATSWPAPNADLANTRSVGGPIDASTVNRLKVAWKVPVEGYAATPIVVHGVVYAQDLESNVYALDLRSGRTRWIHIFGVHDFGPNGVNVGGGRVYGATVTRAFALDARTGRLLWARKLIRNREEGIDMAPGYAAGTVYVSTVPVGRKGGARGVLWAIDGATGRTRWRWGEVPAGLWGRPRVNSGGGVWHTPAFDVGGQLYASIANPAPLIGTRQLPWGSSRPGANRWTNSLVKLDAATGKLVWGRQVLPHDLYDWDLECPPILTRANGTPIVVTAGKMGFVYAFERAGGRLLWKRSVGVHNGHDRDALRALHGGAGLRTPERIFPGVLGGVETQMAVDDGTVYVPVNNLPAVVESQTESSIPNSAEGTGEVVALDVATGRVRWTRKLPEAEYGGATVVNDLVFTTTYEGMLWALDIHGGRVVWSSRLPAGTIAPVAVAGDTLLTAASIPLRVGQVPEIVAYRLAR